MNELGEDVGTCEWPTVVKAGYHCSGVYIGNGLVLTAAHCLEGDNVPGARVSFQESNQLEHLEIDVVECVRHPDGEPSTNVWGEPSYSGVDLAVCVLAEDWPGPATPVMRLGCESNWLSYAFFNFEGPARPRMRAVGVGCNEVNYNSYPPCVASGIKRFWKTVLDRSYPHQLHLGTYKLTHTIPPWADGDPTEQGDSGSPLFVRMPDGTWRVIGVLHGDDPSHVYWEPVPPYVDWIEEVTGRNIAKAPGGGFLRGEEQTASWADSCAALAGQGQHCGGAPLIPAPPPGLTTEAGAADYVESWIVDGLPLAAATAVVEIADQRIELETSVSRSLPDRLADAIRCNKKLVKAGVRVEVKGSMVTLNARLKIKSFDIPGADLRRYGRFRHIDEDVVNADGIFLNGTWEAFDPSRRTHDRTVIETSGS